MVQPFDEDSVRSVDGTTLAYERPGLEPVLILVDAAEHYRDFSSFTGLAELLGSDFTGYKPVINIVARMVRSGIAWPLSSTARFCTDNSITNGNPCRDHGLRSCNAGVSH